jgi:hypothetical protein
MTFIEARETISLIKYNVDFNTVIELITREELIELCTNAAELYLRSIMNTNNNLITEN